MALHSAIGCIRALGPERGNGNSYPELELGYQLAGLYAVGRLDILLAANLFSTRLENRHNGLATDRFWFASRFVILSGCLSLFQTPHLEVARS